MSDDTITTDGLGMGAPKDSRRRLVRGARRPLPPPDSPAVKGPAPAAEPSTSSRAPLLLGLRSDEATRRAEAQVALWSLVRARAKVMLAEMEVRSVSPDSVSNEVFVRAVPRAIDLARDDREVVGYVTRAAHNAIIDRLRRRTRTVSIDDERNPVDPAAGDPGPSTFIADQEQARELSRGLTALGAAIGSAELSVRERTIAMEGLLRDRPWTEIAAELGVPPQTVRQAFRRLRGRLLESILAPLIAEMPSSAAAGLRAFFAAPQPAAAAHSRADIDAFIAWCDDAAVPWLTARFGEVGAARLSRLFRSTATGARRDEAGPQRE